MPCGQNRPINPHVGADSGILTRFTIPLNINHVIESFPNVVKPIIVEYKWCECIPRGYHSLQFNVIHIDPKFCAGKIAPSTYTT